MSIDDQNAVIDAPLVDMSVIAGAGSGKTRTSIGRVLSILGRLPASKRIALLSFSNVAVETFRRGLTNVDVDTGRVHVATFDAFFMHYILIPHAWRLMGCAEKPFLVLGDESFLPNFAIYHGGRPRCITELKIEFSNGAYIASFEQSQVPWDTALPAIKKLAAIGGVTYNVARYWTHCALTHLPYLGALLARRYPYIMIDEAQDIGSMDWALVQLLRQHQIAVCLVGDPAQAIFGFNGGDGRFLQEMRQISGRPPFPLRTNYRSVPEIVHCANRLAGRQDAAARPSLQCLSGAFIVPYQTDEPRLLVDRFIQVSQGLGYPKDDTAIICRANSLVQQIRGGTARRGSGLVKCLVRAVELRIANRYDKAFGECLSVIAALLEPAVPRFANLVLEEPGGTARRIRERIWRFTCDHQGGLPWSTLNARDAWLPLLVANLRSLLDDLGAYGLRFGDIGRRFTTRDLDPTSIAQPQSAWRVDTVHQVKGESIGAVLYLATDTHARALVSGIDSENGRIGYVALTRARDLFWFAVPAEAYDRLVPRAASVGIVPLPA
jgi:superfamily I DNA/RNA helicase